MSVLGKVLGSAKSLKGMKAMGKTFKEAGKNASAMQSAAGSMDLISIALELLAPLFQAFQPILTIFNAMWTAFAGALTSELIPVLMPLFEDLIDMIPIFTELGGIVGQFIGALLVPFVDVLITIIPIFGAFLMSLLQSEEFLIMVNAATILFVSGIMFLIENIDMIIFFVANLIYGFTLLIGNLDTLIPFVDTLMGAFVLLIGNLDTLVPFVNNLVIAFGLIFPIINDMVIPAITAFIYMIAIMIDAITLGAAGAVDYINSIMTTIIIPYIPSGYTPTPMVPTPPGTPGGPGGPQEFQMGTDLITRTGVFKLHAGEAVTSATEVGLQTSLLEEIRDLQREQLLEIKWRMR